ncbi:MAG: acetyl-CoA carboxylase, carboxyltransferase subunit beta [Clostridia bacterium]|nr:acetyl-CoA carboxylase, carboxyltransferase subunit beta [Clostridia bacterium]
MLKDLFRKPKYVTVKPDKPAPAKRDIPEGLWVKCSDCGEIVYTKELEKNQKVCLKCQFHFRLGARERIALVADEESFRELDSNLVSVNPLGFDTYSEKLIEAQETVGINEAVITGEATINGQPVVIGVMDAQFIMGSMGSVVGEKVARMFERGLEKKLPVVLFAASGGARMQEGILALMQMAKTSSVIARFNEAGLLYISFFTDPTTGGVTASFASLGDIILAEPGTLIGFTGPRVIEQTIKQKLPQGFQRAEFMLEHGFVDAIVPRQEIKTTLAMILELHGKGVANG